MFPAPALPRLRKPSRTMTTAATRLVLSAPTNMTPAQRAAGGRDSVPGPFVYLRRMLHSTNTADAEVIE